MPYLRRFLRLFLFSKWQSRGIRQNAQLGDEELKAIINNDP